MPEPYIPQKLPLKSVDYDKLATLIGESNAKLSNYNGLLQAIPNPGVLLSPLITRRRFYPQKLRGLKPLSKRY